MPIVQVALAINVKVMLIWIKLLLKLPSQIVGRADCINTMIKKFADSVAQETVSIFHIIEQVCALLG